MSQQPADIPDNVPPRRFEYADDRSYKFWTIALDGPQLTTRYGRIGHQGQTREVRFDSAEDAKRGYLQRIRQKTRDGYEERVPAKTKTVTSEEIWDKLADHEPFLQAILEAFDDKTPYAVYADWLTEQQDPRGEFIRLQLALEDSNLPMYKRPKLEKSAELIRQRNARQWLGNLAPWLMDRGMVPYPYRFRRGQLAAIVCETLHFRFAHELKKSPHCRFLVELAILSTVTLGEPIQIDDRHYEAGLDYGVEPLLGGDYRNLRELRIGTLPAAPLAEGPFTNTSRLVQWIATMPRLERLWVRADLDLHALLQLPLEYLRELHVRLDRAQIAALSESGRLPHLRVLGSMDPMTDDLIGTLVQVAGFDQLTQFVCHELSSATESAMERLNETGIVLDVKNFPD